MIVAVAITVLVLFFDSLAAFTFAKYRFPGRNVLFGILLADLRGADAARGDPAVLDHGDDRLGGRPRRR